MIHFCVAESAAKCLLVINVCQSGVSQEDAGVRAEPVEPVSAAGVRAETVEPVLAARMRAESVSMST